MDADLTSCAAVIQAAYRAISGPAGAPRDWAAMRLLYHPAARLMPTRSSADSGAIDIFSVEEYIASRTPIFAANDFFEEEVEREEHRFGTIAHVLSTYEARRTPGGPLLLRGVNSFQLWWDGRRWWIMSVLWSVLWDDGTALAPR